MKIENKMNDVLFQFQKNLENIFEDRCIDIYIYGSVARGSFSDSSSDIDFLVFVDRELTSKDINQIILLHQNYRQSNELLRLLEGRYFSVFEKKISNGYYVGTNPMGWHELLDINLGKLEIAMILDCYISLLDTRIIFDYLKFEWKEVKKEIKSQINGFLNNNLLEVDKGYTEYAVVASARSLYTYANQNFISKRESVIWVKENYNINIANNPREYIAEINRILLDWYEN